MADYAETAFFVQVEPDFTSYGGREQVRSIKAVGITQKRPARPKPGTVLVKLTLQIPKAAFLPLRPEAIVVVPESMTAATPVIVEAADPGRPLPGDPHWVENPL